ncbi:TPA: 50S ribosomal protein L9 [Patescibacteria group bacterium]|nr:50S ribosomal protein L9 [Patescibacteria group bacterium]HCU47573.1 50S ribosomal protein L9 [Patescibacteria group bacterium]
MIKVIFLKSVPGVKAGQVKEVSDGYALNYLLPQAIAVKATASKLVELDQTKSRLAEQDRQALARESDWLGVVAGKVVTVKAKASPEGTLYAGITPAAVAEAINQQFGLKLTKKNIDLDSAVKVVGDHPGQVVLGPDKKSQFIIRVQTDHD